MLREDAEVDCGHQRVAFKQFIIFSIRPECAVSLLLFRLLEADCQKKGAVEAHDVAFLVYRQQKRWTMCHRALDIISWMVSQQQQNRTLPGDALLEYVYNEARNICIMYY